MEGECAKFFEFARLEVRGYVPVFFELGDEVGVVAAGVFGFPRFHRVALDKFISLLAGESLLNEREEDGLGIPHAQ